MKRIVLLTTTHLSRNPRLVKEIEALYKFYDLEVIYFQYSVDFQLFDKQIEQSYPSVKFHSFKWTSKYNLARTKGVTITKASAFLFKWFNVELFTEQQRFQGYFSLLKKAVSIKADFYHGHNPGTLAVAVKAAKKNKALSGFDAEDYHRGEYREADPRKKLICKLEDRYIPHLDSFITSSPLIQNAYNKIYPSKQSECILNVFHRSRSGKINRRESSDTIKMVWFSQVVGTDRGLQDIILGINKIVDARIHFSIIGEASYAVKQYLLQLQVDKSVHKIEFKGIFSPEELDDKICQYDVGIASEIGHTENNRYALSNKLFTYLRGGVAILISDTLAQKAFYESYPCIGLLYNINNPDSVYEKIKTWIEDPVTLEEHRNAALSLSHTIFNWEHEQKKLISKLTSLFSE